MNRRWWLTATGAMLVSACGGGGDGEGGSNPGDGGGGGGGGGGGPGVPPAGLPPFVFDPAQAVTLAESATDIGGLIEDPVMATDKAGNALVVYVDNVVSGANAKQVPMALYIESDGTASDAVKLDELPTVGIDQLRVEFNQNGDALAAWMQQFNASSKPLLMTALFNGQTRTWSKPVAVTTPGGTAIEFKEWDAAFADDGKPVIVWTEAAEVVGGTANRTRSAQLQSDVRADGVAWSAPQIVFQRIGSYRDTEPRLAVLPDGKLMLATIGIDGKRSDVVLYSRATPDAAWAQGNVVNGVPSYYLADPPAEGVPQRLALAANAAGRIMLTWEHDFPDGVGVFASVLDGAASPTWSPILPVDSTAVDAANAALPAYGAHVAMDDNGHALVVWVRNDSSESSTSRSVFARRFDGTGFDGPPRLLEQSATQVTGLPAVRFNSAGDAVVSWQQVVNESGGSTSVFASRFEAQTNAFTATALVEGDPLPVFDPEAAALLPNGAAVVVWSDGKRLRGIRSAQQ